jgi:hypothetical protein
MRSFAKIMFVVVLALAATSGFAKPADTSANSLVITFKDGHQQTIPVADIAKMEFKAASSAAAPKTSTDKLSPSTPAHFHGKWRVGDGQGGTFTINLEDNGRAWKSIGSGGGTWVLVDGEARITWDDGWKDKIRKVGRKFEKVAYGPGKSFDDDPANVAIAVSAEPI